MLAASVSATSAMGISAFPASAVVRVVVPTRGKVIVTTPVATTTETLDSGIEDTLNAPESVCVP